MVRSNDRLDMTIAVDVKSETKQNKTRTKHAKIIRQALFLAHLSQMVSDKIVLCFSYISLHVCKT